MAGIFQSTPLYVAYTVGLAQVQVVMYRASKRWYLLVLAQAEAFSYPAEERQILGYRIRSYTVVGLHDMEKIGHVYCTGTYSTIEEVYFSTVVGFAPALIVIRDSIQPYCSRPLYLRTCLWPISLSIYI